MLNMKMLCPVRDGRFKNERFSSSLRLFHIRSGEFFFCSHKKYGPLVLRLKNNLQHSRHTHEMALFMPIHLNICIVEQTYEHDTNDTMTMFGQIKMCISRKRTKKKKKQQQKMYVIILDKI